MRICNAITRVLLFAGACAAGTCSMAHAQVLPSAAGPVNVETFARGLDHPWSMAFLPDGRLLVTERPGRMRILGKDGKASPSLAGIPRVFASGQGGLLDVTLDRAYADNQTLYFCYAEPAQGYRYRDPYYRDPYGDLPPPPRPRTLFPF